MSATRELVLPFAGFSPELTVHDQAIGSTVSGLFVSLSGEPCEDLTETLWEEGVIDYAALRERYAGEYAERFGRELVRAVLPDMAFAELTRPGDLSPGSMVGAGRLFVQAPEEDVVRLKRATNGKILRRHIQRSFAVHEGFVPHYSADPDDPAWKKPVTEWDHNQLATLLEAYLIDHPPTAGVYADVREMKRELARMAGREHAVAAWFTHWEEATSEAMCREGFLENVLPLCVYPEKKGVWDRLNAEHVRLTAAERPDTVSAGALAEPVG